MIVCEKFEYKITLYLIHDICTGMLLQIFNLFVFQVEKTCGGYNFELSHHSYLT